LEDNNNNNYAPSSKSKVTPVLINPLDIIIKSNNNGSKYLDIINNIELELVEPTISPKIKSNKKIIRGNIEDINLDDIIMVNDDNSNDDDDITTDDNENDDFKVPDPILINKHLPKLSKLDSLKDKIKKLKNTVIGVNTPPVSMSMAKSYNRRRDFNTMQNINHKKIINNSNILNNNNNKLPPEKNKNNNKDIKITKKKIKKKFEFLENKITGNGTDHIGKFIIKANFNNTKTSDKYYGHNYSPFILFSKKLNNNNNI